MSNQSGQQCKFLLVHTLLCVESWSTDSWGVAFVLYIFQWVWSQKPEVFAGRLLGGVNTNAIIWQFAISSQISEFHIFTAPNVAPFSLPPWADAPFSRSRRHFLRSSNTNLLQTFQYHYKLSNFTSRAFSVSTPSTWNSLPAHIRSLDKLSTFKRQLKSHLFQSAFAVYI